MNAMVGPIVYTTWTKMRDKICHISNIDKANSQEYNVIDNIDKGGSRFWRLM